MYIRIYNNQLIKVFTAEEDLNNSEIIGKIKGREPAGFTFRDEKNYMVFYPIDKITAKELQLLIRKSKTATIAINLTDEEALEYFYIVARVQIVEHNKEKCTEDELCLWMHDSIDAGIINSSVWGKIKPKVVQKLEEEGFLLLKEKKKKRVRK